MAIASATGVDQVNFRKAIISCYTNYFRLRGRATRREYWLFTLFTVIVRESRHLLHLAIHATAKSEYMTLALLMSADYCLMGVGASALVPQTTALVRRLHDIGRSGWWIGGEVLLLVGSILVLTHYSPNRRYQGPHAASFFIATAFLGAALICGLTITVFSFQRGNIGPNKFGPPNLV